MEKICFISTKPVGKKTKLLHFKSVLPLVLDEPDTVNWYGLQMGPSTFEF
jgi:hypothetical protein